LKILKRWLNRKRLKCHFLQFPQTCLESIQEKYITKTQHTGNPFNPQKLSWASWIIARLGGWKRNITQGKAGPIIIKRRIEKFQIMYEGWKLAHEDTQERRVQPVAADRQAGKLK
jgi:hypothetical protein